VILEEPGHMHSRPMEGQVSVQISVANDKIGAIIGKKGTTIKYLEGTYGVKVVVRNIPETQIFISQLYLMTSRFPTNANLARIPLVEPSL